MPEVKIIATAEAENRGEVYKTDMNVHQHTVIADEPPQYGGKDTGPSPTDYLCMALASCKVITLRMYAQRKNWNVEQIKVKVDLIKGSSNPLSSHTFYSEISVAGSLTEEQKKRLLEISKACPIHKLLMKPSEMVTVIL